MELVFAASSAVDGVIGCWDLPTGAEQLRYKTSSSPSHGLVALGTRFLASSQLRDSSATSGSIFFWDWSKPQVEVKSFPVEPIKPLAVDYAGIYLAGGGLSGDIYFWETETGKLLTKWHAHNRPITCLTFNDDGSLLLSGCADGSIRVWNLVMVLDNFKSKEAKDLVYSLSEHTLPVTDLVIGMGGWNALIISASEDRTCKVWSLASGTLLRSISFPSKINTIVLEPTEQVFYAGSKDGKIFTVALTTTKITDIGKNIVGSFSNHSKEVTCLAVAVVFGTGENLVISGSEDGIVRVWNARTQNLFRMFKHGKGPITNVIVVRHDIGFNKAPSKNQDDCIPTLEKYVSEEPIRTVRVRPGGSIEIPDYPTYYSADQIAKYAKEFENQDSATASKMEMERLKQACNESFEAALKWKKMYEDLQEFCVKEMVDPGQARTSDGNDK